jgi:Zn-finger nucleic acid-binding protein
MIPESALDDLRSRNPVDELAGKYVTLRRNGKKLIGPCPICSSDRTSRTATRFECDADGFCCAVCLDGGDAIKLVQKVEGKTFLEAVEWLGGTKEIDVDRARELDETRKRKEAQREKESNHFRDRERRTLWDIWLHAEPIAGTYADSYLQLRGIKAQKGVRLKHVPDMPYFVQRGHSDPIVVHRGPAMIAPIIRPDGHFGGLHFTYIDVNAPKGKLQLEDPETHEILPTKKSRGSKKDGHIDLIPIKDQRKLIIGEGIEKVLAVWLALSGRDLSTTAFRTSVDLGNLGGRAAESITHPTLKTDKGRPQRVPGPIPDLSTPGIPIPESVDSVIILGDSTSDRLTTECAIARAERRWRKEGRSICVAWSPDGEDFDDLLRAA